MKFSTKQDIEAPLAFVYQALIDIEHWERAAMRRGADVSRTDQQAAVTAGMSWQARFEHRGKKRDIAINMTDLTPFEHLGFSGISDTVGFEASLDLLELSARRTRLHVTIEVKPRTLGARLFIQSMRLARTRIDRNFDQRIVAFVAQIEQRQRDYVRAKS